MRPILLLRSSGLRYTVRGLRRRPLFAAAAVLTLALGIGATTAIFSVVYGVLLKPLPYPGADELVSIQHSALGLTARNVGISESMFITYQEQNHTFQHIGMWDARELTLQGREGAERISAAAVTDGVLQALGARPRVGRLFSGEEYSLGGQGPAPAILSYALWQRRFGGDASALGSTISLDSVLFQVVGIMPAGFRFLNLTPQPEVITAIRTGSSQIAMWGGNATPIGLGYINYNGLARLKDGATLEDANADVARMLPIWLDAWPASASFRESVANWRLAPAVRPLKEGVVAEVAGELWLLMATVGAVLLIACANIANLLLVRADERRREFAIRTVLGAGHWRIVGEILRESLVLGAIGGAVGLSMASAGLGLLAVIAPANLPRVEEISVGPPVLAFAVAATLLSGLAFGSIPAVKLAFGSEALPGSETYGASASRPRNHTRKTLIVVQVALAVVLLVGAGLMIRTFQSLTAIDPGFDDPEDIQVARIFIPPVVMREPARYNRAYRDIGERIAALPGVTSVGFSGGVPFQGLGAYQIPIAVEDQPRDRGVQPLTYRFWFSSPGYLDALGTRLVAGRSFTWSDMDEARSVAIVSANVARELWGSPEAAIGRRIRSAQSAAGSWSEIVGVAQDVRQDGLYKPAPPMVYWPWREGSDLRAITYVIRSDRAGTESFANEVRHAVWGINPDVPVFELSTMRDIYARSLARTSFMLVLLAISAAMALLLSVVGIYGVISCIVSQRAREIGIRLALGAKPQAVKRMIVLHALTVVGIGVATGLAVAAAFSRLLTSLIFEIRPLDPTTYVTVLGLVLAAAALAAYRPAARAARIDPADTLRTE